VTNSISGYSTSSAMQGQQAHRQQSLSQEQRQLIETTLAKYDSGNLTQSDAISIVEAFKEAGIQPGKGLAEAMAESGFDAKAVGELAGVAPPPGGPKGQPVTLNISEDMLQELNKLLDEYYSGDLSSDEQETTLSAIKEIFRQTVPEGGLVNMTA